MLAYIHCPFRKGEPRVPVKACMLRSKCGGPVRECKGCTEWRKRASTASLAPKEATKDGYDTV